MTREEEKMSRINFWDDSEHSLINPNLFSETASQLAKTISDEKRKNANKYTQLRKFYDEVIRFNNIIKFEKDQFYNLLPYIKMLNAKAAYAEARELISRSFKDFIKDSVEQVNEAKDIEVFTSFFEAFMGFYKYYDKKLS